MNTDNSFQNMFEISYDIIKDMFLKRKYINDSSEIDENIFKEFGKNDDITEYKLNDNYIIIKGQQTSKSTGKKKNSNQTNETKYSKYKDIDVIILIADKSPTKKDSESLGDNVIEIYLGDWTYNPLENDRQATFEILNDEQKQNLLSHYDIKDSNLPKMDINDKISRFYACKEKDIFKITRYTPRNGIQIYYRIVRSIV
jgi:DNA-directed RNA polymerase subunit H (RpoH/RPB5)